MFVVNQAFRNVTGRGQRCSRRRRSIIAQFPKVPTDRASTDSKDKVVTVIGKLSANRGFEEALQTFAALRRSRRRAG